MNTDVWATKHRPNTLNKIYGQSNIVNELLQIVIGEMPMQHYIFYSPEAGTGKTSMAIALANDLGYQLVVFNASSKKERGIEFVEDIIIPMVRNGVKERIFLLDEADQLTDAAQSALKGVIENSNGYFILTCNRLPKVSRWLQSRCQVRTFEAITENDMRGRLREVFNYEMPNGTLSEGELNAIVRKHKGDLRNAIGAMQTLVHLDSKDRSNFVDFLTVPEIDYDKFLRICFRDKSYSEAVKMMTGDVRQQVRNIFEFAVNSKGSPNNKMVVIGASVTAERDILNGVDEQIVRHNFVRMLVERIGL